MIFNRRNIGDISLISDIMGDIGSDLTSNRKSLHGEMKSSVILVIFNPFNIGDMGNIGIIQPDQTLWVILAET